MKLTAQQKYDYRDLDRGEAQLMRVGHALWRDRRKLGDTVTERFGNRGRTEFRGCAEAVHRIADGSPTLVSSARTKPPDRQWSVSYVLLTSPSSDPHFPCEDSISVRL
jgi:hypothetical protein